MRAAPVAALVGLAAVASAAGVATPTLAAIRYCAPPIRVMGDHPSSEKAARRLALDRWKDNAARIAPEWASWRLAARRDVRCERRGVGGYLCRVTASPCAIAQNPATPPPIRPDARPPVEERDANNGRSRTGRSI